MTDTGQRIRRARRAAGHTQKTLAEELGVESITVSRWERNVTTPTLQRIREIARITETSMSELVHDETDGDQMLVEIHEAVLASRALLEELMAKVRKR